MTFYRFPNILLIDFQVYFLKSGILRVDATTNFLQNCSGPDLQTETRYMLGGTLDHHVTGITAEDSYA